MIIVFYLLDFVARIIRSADQSLMPEKKRIPRLEIGLSARVILWVLRAKSET